LKVLYVTSNGGIHDYRFLKKLAGDYEVLLLHYAANELIDEIKDLKNLKIISKKPFIKAFPLLTELLHFRKVYKSFKPDIVHTGYVWQAGILASLLNIRHHLSMPWGSDILFEPDESLLKRILVKKVMRQCSRIQCDAEFVKNKIIKDYNIQQDKITVFPWGIDLKLFKEQDKKLCRKELGIKEDAFVIIFTRHLEPVYGINDLLEGFKLFCRDKKNIRLLLLSGGSLKNDTINFIGNNNLSSSINLIGKIPNAKLPVYLGASDVYVSPSISDGTSLSLLEALAVGPGIVVTGVPAIKEWVSQENGFVVPVNNPEEIGKAFEGYFNNRELILKHAAVNKKIASARADWDKNYLKLKEMYNNIIN
jgi:glycosyltransferase involved in cell wall biosynthesis